MKDADKTAAQIISEQFTEIQKLRRDLDNTFKCYEIEVEKRAHFRKLMEDEHNRAEAYKRQLMQLSAGR